MKIRAYFLIALLSFGGTACKNGAVEPDAYGQFEASETIVSAEGNGKIVALTLEEGQTLNAGQVVGALDASNLTLQKEQLQASMEALGEKTLNAAPQLEVIRAQMQTTEQQVGALRAQIAVTKQQIENLEVEKRRVQNLIRENAATQKNLDDITGQIAVLQRQLAVQQEQIQAQESQLGIQRQQIQAQTETVNTQNRSILSEEAPLAKRIAQVEDQIAKTNIVNPVNGTVLVKYVNRDEIANFGKPLYKIADLSEMTLRAYVSATQLAKVKVGGTAKVVVDALNGEVKTLNGTVSWISPKAEFTPKTILTKEERANLVYAVKIRVPNPNGLLKIGMTSEVVF